MGPVFLGDKRGFPRFQVSISVRQFKYNDALINSHTFDISANGIGLVMDAELPLGQPLDIDLSMPDTGEAIHLHGKAVWMTIAGPGRYRAGIHIDEDHFKPIPLVLRTIRLRSHYYG